jgi:hypothetical protein
MSIELHWYCGTYGDLFRSQESEDRSQHPNNRHSFQFRSILMLMLRQSSISY